MTEAHQTSLEVVPSQHGGYVLRYPNGTFWTPSGPLSWPPSMWNGPTSGRWTSLEGAKRALDNIRRGKKPESDEPGVSESHMVRDYIAVDPGGRVVGGPFKDYSEAKARASKAGGYVQFAMGEATSGIVRDDFRDPKGKKFRLTFLPYAEMEPYNNGFTSGRFEEFFRTRFEAQTRMRQLIDEGRIEEAEIHESVSVPSGSGSSQGGTISMRLVDQWHDTGPNARKDRRTGQKRAPTNGAKGVRIETEEHRRQYAAERASEDYYEAWMEAAGDWATRSELIDAWLVDHPEVVVGAWIDTSGIREMNATRRKRTPTSKQAGAHNHLHGKLDESRVQARPSKRSTDDRKAAWMRAFQDAATALGAVGKLVWQDAEYLYSQGVDSLTAARRIYGPRSSKPGDLQASRAPLALPSGPVRHRRRIGQKPLSARRRAR